MSKSRLESFSDGVIAVAITLLVLGITVPTPNAHHRLVHELLRQWPAYAAYVISFVTIGIIWINQLAVLGRLDRADHAILLLNLLLLLCIGVVPFATSLMATYLRRWHRCRRMPRWPSAPPSPCSTPLRWPPELPGRRLAVLASNVAVPERSWTPGPPHPIRCTVSSAWLGLVKGFGQQLAAGWQPRGEGE